MRVLLDSHAFLWLAEAPDQLSSEANRICQSAENVLIFSLVSLWELQIKMQLGKLHTNLPLQTMLHEQQRINNIELLTVTPSHIFALSDLQDHHRDPFDRLLIAQALTEGLPILSRDSVFSQYAVRVVW